MKKLKKGLQKIKASDLSHYEASEIAEFLENFQRMVHGKDEKTKLISLRVPENILNAFKLKAKKADKKYQTLIVDLMREWLLK